MSKPVNAIALILAAVLLVPIASYAAGLGALTVRSALGQPLDAELEVLSLRPGEETFQTRLASRDAYRDAGMDYSPALGGVRFSVENRGGKTIIRLRTTQPVNDPYLNLLVELHFPTGRLARQYTVLVDPAEYKLASAPAPTSAAAAPAPAAPPPAAAVPASAATSSTDSAAPPVAAISTAPRTPEPVAAPKATAAPIAEVVAKAPAPAASAVSSTPTASAVAPASTTAPAPAAVAPTLATPAVAAVAPPAPSGAASAPSGADSYRIKRGDTLGAIARKWKHDGVTTQQMMIGLYQGNPGAFIRENINLIRSGATLIIPMRDVVLAIGEEDAARRVRSQIADFNKYRRSHAGAGGSGPSVQASRDTISRRLAGRKATRSM